MHGTGRVSTVDLETELRKCWKTGYRELKDIMRELSKQDYYRYLAARYMETGYPGVVSEFQSALADVYGIESFQSAERDSKREVFWKELKTTK